MTRNQALIAGIGIAIFAAFLGWRLVRPMTMNIFVVSDYFERPIYTSNTSMPTEALRARTCGACHREIYAEWKTSIHSQV